MTKPLACHRPIVRLALSRTELALSIGVSTTSIDKMVTEGALPAPRKWHSRKLWLVSEVEAHLGEWPNDGDDSANEWGDWEREEVHKLEMRPATAGQAGPPIKTAKPTPDPLMDWYRQIGFDPETMSHGDRTRLMQEARGRWAASVIRSELGKRERGALEQLASFGVGVEVRPARIKSCGPDTMERLKARGYVVIRGDAERIWGITLTDDGIAAWRACNG